MTRERTRSTGPRHPDRPRKGIARTGGWISMLMAWSLLGAVSRAQTDEPDSISVTPAVPPFVRVFVPEEALEQWPRDGRAYLPVPADEFERLVQLSRGEARESPKTPAAYLSSIRVRAEFVPPHRLQGEAELRFQQVAPVATMYPLIPWGQALRGAFWQRLPEVAVPLGTSERQIPLVRVEQSDVLHVAWDLAGELDVAGMAKFRWRWPRTPIVAGYIDLPEDRLLQVGGANPVPIAGAAPGLRRWEFSLPPTGESSLRVSAPPGAAVPESSHARWRHASHFEVSPFHLELTAQLTVQGRAQSVSAVDLSLESPLDISAVEHDGAWLRWHPLPTAAENVRQVRIELPETPVGEDCHFTVRARGARSDEPHWSLPRVNIEQARWEAGTILLRVAKPLVLARVEETGCQVVGVRPYDGAERGTEVKWESFSPQATAEVWLTQAAPPWAIACGTTTTIGADAIEARVVVDLRGADDANRLLVGVISGDWQVDRVAAQPDNLAEWTVDSETSSPAGRILKVRFQQPISAEEPVRLTIVARRPHAPSDAPLTLGELEAVAFPQERYVERWLAVRPAAGSRLPTRHNLPDAVSFVDLRPEVRSLFEDISDLLVVPLDWDNRGRALAWEPLRPEYRADVRVEAQVAQSQTLFQAAVRLVTPRRAWQQVLVHFPRALVDTPHWHTLPDEGLPVTASRLLPEEQAQVGLSGGETWRVQWRSPQQAEFVLLAEWSRPSEPATELDVLAIVGAEPQQGELSVRGDGKQAVWVEPRGLLSAAREEADLTRISALVSRLRFDPARYLSNAAVPLAVLHREEASAVAACRVWQADLQSCYEADGSSQHWLRYEIEQDQPGSSLRLTPVGPLAAERLSVTGCAAVRQDTDGALDVLLPAQERFPVVHVYYRQHGAAWRFWGRPQVPHWQLSAPVLARRWTVWLRPGCLLLGGDRPDGQTAYRWTQRLFGPLGRTAEHPPALPHIPLPAGGTTSGQRLAPSSRRAVQWLETVGNTLNAGDSSSGITWSDFLQSVSQALPRMPVPWLVDAPALSALPLQPSDQVTTRPTGNARHDAMRLLSDAQLSVLVAENVIVLTTRARVTSQPDLVESIEEPVVWQVKGMARSATRPSASGVLEWSGLTTPHGWNRLPVAAWRATAATRPPVYELPGWIAWDGGNPQDKRDWRILAEARIRGLGWGVFLATLALAMCGVVGGARGVLRAAGVCGVVALCVPDAWVVVVSGAALGFLACVVLQGLGWRRGPRSGSSSRTADSPRGVASPGSIALALGGLLVVAVGSARAAETPDPLRPGAVLDKPPATDSPSAVTAEVDSPDAAEKLSQVLVPVDAQQRPVAGNYLVPEGLLERLLRREAELGSAPRGCVIWDAEYRVRLVRAIPSDPVTVASWVALFQVEAFDRPPTIRLPVGPVDRGRMPVAVRLDGDPVDFGWQEAGQMLVCPAPGAGRFLLELEYPSIKPDETAATRELNIPAPAVLHGHLDVSLPEASLALDVPSAVGDAQIMDGGLRRRYRLGPSARLQLAWHDPDRDAQRIGGAETLHWLRWAAGERTLESRVRWEPPPGESAGLRLAFDPRLRFVVARIHGERIASEQIRQDDAKHVLELNLPTAAGPLAVETVWRWEETSRWGHVTLPRVRCVDVSPVREWLAVSLDPEMTAEWDTQDQQRSLSTDDFLAAWDPMASPPALCCRLIDSPDGPVLRIGPARERPVVHETTSWHLTAAGSRLDYHAQLEPSGGQPWHYQLRVPRELKIDELTTTSARGPLVLQWTKPQDGVLALLGPVEPQAEWELRLRGWMPAAASGPRQMAAIEWLDAESVSPQVHLWRGPEVQASWSDPRVSSELPAPRPGLPQGEGRFVGWYDPSVGRMPVEVETSANQPQWTWRQMTRISQEGTDWQAEVSLHIDVQQGVLDALRLDVPQGWEGVARIEPAWSLRELPGASEDRRQWIVRPSQALSGPVRLVLRGPLLAGERSRQVPVVRLIDAPPGEVQLVLPTQSNLEPLRWETRGLLRTELPSEIQQLPVAPESFIAYRAVDPVYAAELGGLARSAGSARVTLMDVWLARDTEGGIVGNMGIDLDPHGTENCPLRLPQQVELLQVRVCSRVAHLQPVGERHWAIPLDSPWLPQHVDVLFRCPSADWNASSAIDWSGVIPQVGDLPIEQRLWTLFGDDHRVVPTLKAREVSSLRADVIRLATNIRQGVAASASTTELAELADWRRVWNEPIQRRMAALQDMPPAAWDGTSRRLFQQAASQATSLLNQEQGEDAAGGRSRRSVDVAATSLWEQSVASGLARRSWWEETPSAAGRSTAAPFSNRPLPARVVQLGLVVLWGGIVWYLVRLRRDSVVWRWFERWPAVAGVALGFAVWLVCEPDWLGWGLMALASVSGWFRRAR